MTTTIADLDAQGRHDLAVRLADAWTGTDVDVDAAGALLADVHDQVGHDGFIDLLAECPGKPAVVAALLSADRWIVDNADTVARYVKGSPGEVASLPEESSDRLLDGDVDASVTKMLDVLGDLAEVFEPFVSRNALFGGGKKFAVARRMSSEIRTVRAEIMSALHPIERVDFDDQDMVGDEPAT